MAETILSRAARLSSGDLRAVPDPLSREAGFRHPVALTAAAWAKCVTIPKGVRMQDETGRLWDVLSMLRFAIRRQGGDTSRISYSLHVRKDNRERTPPLVALLSVCGPGDQGEPVITIGLRGESI